MLPAARRISKTTVSDAFQGDLDIFAHKYDPRNI